MKVFPFSLFSNRQLSFMLLVIYVGLAFHSRNKRHVSEHHDITCNVYTVYHTREDGSTSRGHSL